VIRLLCEIASWYLRRAVDRGLASRHGPNCCTEADVTVIAGQSRLALGALLKLSRTCAARSALLSPSSTSGLFGSRAAALLLNSATAGLIK
jgi:hypothetical protein